MIEFLLPPVQRWLLYTGVLLLVGVSAWRSFIRPRLERAPTDTTALDAVKALDATMLRTGRLLALALLLVWGLRLQVQLLGFRDPFAPILDDLRILILGTSWGEVWIAQGVLLVALAALFGLAAGDARRAAMRQALLWTGTLLLVLTLSLSSHAMSADGSRALAVMADVLHVLGAGLWIGTLALILRFPARLSAGSMRRNALAIQLRAFSPLAMIAVALLVAAGTYGTAMHLTALSDLWTSAYGRTLAAKIATAGAALGLGLLNWRRGLPVLDTEEGARTVFRRAAAEVAVVALALLFTAILTGRTLPR